FDHRGRIDVGLNPDQPEGVWLRHYLESHEIPYFAFRAAVAGKATAPHIHIGPGSTRLLSKPRAQRSGPRAFSSTSERVPRCALDATD
ncbi:MAG: hypothetical protein ACRD9L_02260, partial [Bryobacteraceae bacterium]